MTQAYSHLFDRLTKVEKIDFNLPVIYVPAEVARDGSFPFR